MIARAGQPSDHLHQCQQILDPERAPASGERHKRVHVASIRPRPRQRALHPILIEEEHPVLAPRPAAHDKHELATPPRVERMRHTDSSLPTSAIKRSCKRSRTPSARRSTPASRKSGSTDNPGQPEPRHAPRSSSTSRAGTTHGAGTPRSATSPRSSSNDSTPSSHNWRSTPRFRPTDRSRRSRRGAQTRLQRVTSRRSASIPLPTPRSLPRTPSLF